MAWLISKKNIPDVGDKLTNIVYNNEDQGGPMLTFYFGEKGVPVHCGILPKEIRDKHGIEDYKG